ncbi:YebC/PmpR family DNA-binding transcriptional regulator [Patescibacteria group bacterium]|nr:YebC/PmpR family DNA-binding transcriptional regulator [Patescibacteria group bacterium]MCL5091914.1 YebC/PmpR family DNA-binding transcriptional regulator [Patescibacteria group bacterium]
MSGHSKWANIKRKKEVNDKLRGSLFTKLTRMITLAVLEGNGMTDPDYNFRLRLAIDKAKQLNMPKDNIARAIEKGIGPNKSQLKELFYEGFAPGGVALIIHATTDNHNRTMSEIRNVMEKGGGKLGDQGAVAYLFQKCGVVMVDKQANSQEAVLAFADRIGAFDIEEDDESFIVYFPFERLGKIRDQFQGLTAPAAELCFRPTTSVTVADPALFDRVTRLAESLESLDDVHGVYTNLS